MIGCCHQGFLTVFIAIRGEMHRREVFLLHSKCLSAVSLYPQSCSPKSPEA